MADLEQVEPGSSPGSSCHRVRPRRSAPSCEGDLVHDRFQISPPHADGVLAERLDRGQPGGQPRIRAVGERQAVGRQLVEFRAGRDGRLA